MKNIARTEAKEKIEEFFKDIKNKNLKNVKKIKRVSMKYKILLKEKRKLFCKKCLMPFSGKEKIRIKNNIKSIKCGKCEYVNRWKIK